MNKTTLFFLLISTLFIPSITQAEEFSWDQLTGEQQTVLKRFEGEWGSLPDEQKQRLTKGAERWKHMTP